MLLFIIVLFLFFLLNLLIKNKKALIITYTLVLVILAGLRGINVGSDTWMYNNIFANYSKVSYLTIFSNFKNLKDPFFYLFIKLLSTLHFNVRMMFIFFSLVYVCSFEKFIYKYSKNVFLSNMLFITLPYYFFGMTAVRQSTALAICLWGMDFLIEKKYIKFIFSILIASLFHKTALIFISAVLLINRKIKAYPFAFVIIALILSKYSSSLIFNLINKLFVEQRAEYYLKNSNSLNYTLLLVNSVILLVTYFIYKQNNEEDFFFNKSYYLVLLGICFLPFCTIIAEFFRISMYFMVYIIIILPNAIHKLKNKNSKFIYELSLVIIMIIYMIISNGNNYGVFPYNFL